MPQSFLKGKTFAIYTRSDDAVLLYQAHPDDKTYEPSPDWQRLPQFNRIGNWEDR